MARVIFGWLFIILVYFFFTNSLVSQLQQPVLIYPGSDNSFWILHTLNIPQFLMQHYLAALGFDILLTCSCIVCIVLPQQRLFTWLTVVGVWLLYVIYGSVAGKHYAQIGYLLAPLPFLAMSQQKFDISWNLFRYWVCFLYAYAGLSKIYFGGFEFTGNMSNILMQDNAEWFIFYKHGWQYNLINFLVDNPTVAQWFYRAASIFELIVLIGFFTKRFDKWLLIALISFHIANFLLLHISFVEQSLIFAAFLPWKKWGTTTLINITDD